MMDEYYDDDFSDESQKHNKKKLKPNPNGPYKIEDFLFQGVLWDIVIENPSYDEFKVTAATDDDVTEEHLSQLKDYLRLEGFEQAARKHNLFW